MPAEERVHLDDLATEGFELSLPPVPNVRVLRRLLRQHPTVQVIDRAMLAGAIGDPEIDDLVTRLLEGFRSGRRFPHTTALAAIAVLLEPRFSPFAETFLRDLASLRLEEIRAAIEMAKLCQIARQWRAGNGFRSLRLVRPKPSEPRWSPHPSSSESPSALDTIATMVVRESAQRYG